MKKHGGYLVAKALKEQGVECIFTLCGGHVAPIYDGCLDEEIRVVDMRHEQACAHAADGWARITGRPGVAVVTAGPGVTDAVTGVANALRATSPMLIIGGQGPLNEIDRGALQEMNHVELMRPVTKWSRRVHETSRIPEYIADALRHANSGLPGPVFLEIPVDLLFNHVEADSIRYATDTYIRARTQGDPESIQQAADLLKDSKKPVIMAGTSVWWSQASDQLQQFSDRFSIPTYLNGMGRGNMPPGHPCFFVHTRKQALSEADVLLMVGTPFDFRLGYGHRIPEETRIIQIELEGSNIGHNRLADIGIVGDIGLVLTQLEEELSNLPNDDASQARKDRLAEMRKLETKHQQQVMPQLQADTAPIHPLRFCAEVAKFVSPDTIVIGDGGDIVGYASKVVKVQHPGHWLDPGPLGCLGVGMPFAIAAKLARPDKEVLIIYGDGAFGFNGMEYETAVRHNLPILGIIGNDAAWGQIRRPQVALFGEDRAIATELAFTRYDKVVEALGGYGEYVESADQILPALERARASRKPACVNVKISGEPAAPPKDLSQL